MILSNLGVCRQWSPHHWKRTRGAGWALVPTLGICRQRHPNDIRTTKAAHSGPAGVLLLPTSLPCAPQETISRLDHDRTTRDDTHFQTAVLSWLCAPCRSPTSGCNAKLGSHDCPANVPIPHPLPWPTVFVTLASSGASNALDPHLEAAHIASLAGVTHHLQAKDQNVVSLQDLAAAWSVWPNC